MTQFLVSLKASKVDKFEPYDVIITRHLVCFVFSIVVLISILFYFINLLSLFLFLIETSELHTATDLVSIFHYLTAFV